jgi:hypothetical protein
MDAIYAAGILALIALVLWAATRQNEIFRVTIAGGQVTRKRGTVPSSFLGDVRAIARHIGQGSVSAIKQDGEARLVFSTTIDERAAQRLRNAFALDSGRKRL